MRINNPRTLLFFCLRPLILLLLLQPVHGQSTAPLSDAILCSANRSIYPCQAYALYRPTAAATLPALDLASVGDLFDVSRLAVARASNLTIDATLRPGQPLLVPLTCSCNLNLSYAAVSYQIAAGDTFYDVSVYKFGNLTSYPTVELVNPVLVPTNLTIGVVAVIPIPCACFNGSRAVASNGSRRSIGLVTYVLQPSDTYSSVAASFGTEERILETLNGPQNGTSTFSTIFVPLFKSPPPLLLANGSAPAPTSPPAVKEREGVIIGLAIALGVFGALLLLLLARMIWRRCAANEWRFGAAGIGDLGSKGGSADGLTLMKGSRGRGLGRSGSAENLMSEISELLDKYKVYRIEELKKATADFDGSCLIAGTVYRGALEGEVFAIKKMKWNAREELKILQKVNHTNLVKLEGFCIDDDGGSCYLVYEHVANGSLDRWLGDPAAAGRLDWRTRLRVALDVANGLQYIHEHTRPRVVHKDVKSSNVLLDAHFRAKVANFGLARTGLNAVTTHIVGTQGYVAPEYLADGVVTTKVDVFAYGVLLLELVSGREAAGAEGRPLWAEAKDVFERMGKREGGSGAAAVMGWVDPVLAEQTCPAESIMRVMGLARECLRRDPARRPSMVEVAYSLAKADERLSDYSFEGRSVDGTPQTVGR